MSYEFQLWFLYIYDALLVVISTFVTSIMTRNMVDLKDEILTKVDEKFNDFKIAIIVELREQIKQEVSKALEKEIKKREELESTVSMLQEHVQIIKNKWMKLRTVKAN